MMIMVRDTRILTSLGLRRVKPYVQYAVGLCVKREVLSNGALGRLIWSMG
jgi:hypothetical protein